MVRWRVNLILLLFFLFGAVIIGQLFYIQIVKNDFYRALAQGLYSREVDDIGERGRVFFRNGEPLAVNINWPLVFASPVEIEEKEEIAGKLAEILELEKDFILNRLSRESLYEPLKKRVSQQEAEAIENLKIRGIYIGWERGRYYPQASLASQVIGFVDADGEGRYGIEGHYNHLLQGKKNEAGRDIVLTIDYAVQLMAEHLLEEAHSNLNIEGGEIIVMNPYSGEILALANYPGYNPNEYSKVSDFSVFKNSATQKIFEPGSIFKPITMAAAVEEEKVTPQTAYVDPGFVTVGARTIYNYDRRVWGKQTMTEVMEKSINTGVVFALSKMGNNTFLEYLEKFGFFERSGLDFPEVHSENRHFRMGYEINFVTASYGQGIEMTPVQLLRSFNVIANNGYLVDPYLVKEIKGEPAPEQTRSGAFDRPIISSKTSSQLTAMLVSVTENGFAKSARVPGYQVAGKTGTAQVAWSAIGVNRSGYSDKTWQSFIGFVPAFDPEFIILVKLDNPAARTAEYSATPIFQQMAKYMVDYFQIPPEEEIEETQ